MNLTNNILRVTRSVNDLENVLNELSDPSQTLISASSINYQFHAAIDNFREYDKILNAFPFASAKQVRFKIAESRPLHALILGRNYERICLFNQKNGDSNRFLHYQMEIQQNQERMTLRIGLSCQKLRQKSKDDFIALISHLVRKKLLNMTNLEIEDFANCIMEINSDAFSGISSFKDQFEVLTVPDFKPVGGIHFVPSIITLDFTKKHSEALGGFEKMAVAFLTAMDSFFENQEYVVKGTIICGNDEGISHEITSIPYQTVRIPVTLHLDQNQLRFLSQFWSEMKCKRKRIEIKHFAWKDAVEDFTENRITIAPTPNIDEIEIVTEFDRRIPNTLINSLKKGYLVPEILMN